MDAIMWRSGYNYDIEKVSDDTALVPVGKSYTVQSQKDEADINVLVKRFGITGEFPVLDRLPLNADFDDVFDFQSAMNVIRSAQESFDSLHADIRGRFHNDPHEFVDFCSHLMQPGG